jgi:hypothetical protein
MKQAACPRCGGGPLVAFVVDEYIYEVRPPANYPGALPDIMPERLPRPPGAQKSQVRCGGCGIHWPKVNLLVREWQAAGYRSR